MRVITFKLDEETVEELNRVAEMLGVSRSEVIRVAILRFIRENAVGRVKVRRVLLG